MNTMRSATITDLSVLCADVGSIKANKFGWAGTLACGSEVEGSCIERFAHQIADELRTGKKLAIGFECPMFVPVRKDPARVNSARQGEGNRSWSAGAGTGALATGLVEMVWVMNRVNELLERTPSATFRWADFLESDSTYLWEAFVTSSAKGARHIEDARIAVERFRSALPEPESANAVHEENVLSLAGAAAIRTGWASSPKVLSEPCLVIKA
jgi:hypothetical protein